MVCICVLGITTFSQAQRPGPIPSAQLPRGIDIPLYLIEYDGTDGTMNNIEQAAGVTIRHRYQAINVVAIAISPTGAARDIRAINGVTRVVQDDLFQLSLEESHAQTQALIAQQNGKTGEGCGIAVLDSGIDDRHCMFAGKLTRGSACFSTNFVDPTFVAQSACPRGTGGSLGDATLANTYEVFQFFPDHGSNVAGIAAGNACSGLALDLTTFTFEPHTSPGGVASGAHIIPINVFTRFSGAFNGDFAFCSDILAGLDYVLMNKDALGVCAVNMSLGGGLSGTHCIDFLSAVIDMLTAEGVAVTIATGNAGDLTGVSFPSCIESAIAVGALDDNGSRAGFSNHLDPLVDLMAPGVDITSAVSDLTIPTGNDFFIPFTGTSMATPTVAGAFAILKSACPEANVDDMLSVLQETGAAVPGVTAKSIRINNACELLIERFRHNEVIPTMSEWGLMIFGLLTLNLGVIFVRRKETVIA